LKSFTPNYRVYGDLGRYPIYIDIKIWSISYWARLLSGKQAKFVNVFYRLSRKLNQHGDTNLNGSFYVNNSKRVWIYIYGKQKRLIIKNG
jgi:hypothetical protein